ncbi:adenylate/guanylate cyclase domain-containing protein [Parasedimentitalea maritima]|uniref:Adenylate/guanylate cyclase domain-containing protein n=1 Tax=Parasedimentitalea maritima TaxID=2578117 RepID=A0A5R8ZJ62_9RHOB|nr:adenylate/guanylate cyclase domain-containing protein [Zongyanglinia marina]KAE9631028.1 adenylate/guanylate cyclase domain-containing protein [Zongyanglinia marina]TLP65812.1 adenylate/guanylate cyclase domain-containing protein [Zongyanglinia marina]
MTDTTFATQAIERPERHVDLADTVADNAYAEAALEAHKQRGLEWAVRARWIAMPIIGIMLVFINPAWDVVYYHGILVLLCANGWMMGRMGKVGRSKAELFLIFLDLLLMTVTMVVPNPFAPQDFPIAMQYRFDNFIYFYVILAAGTLAYSWRTVIAIGFWSAGMWTTALIIAWWFSSVDTALQQAAVELFGDNDLLARFMDPTSFMFHLRIQEVVVFVIVAVTLGFSVRRFNALLMNNASLSRERANLSRYFSPNVVDQLSQNDDPLKQVRKQDVAVLFIDIVGFTRMAAKLDALEVIELLRGFHGRMEREVFRHHGTLDKYLGDGLMATFGTPMAGPQDATNALACARDMMEVLEQWNLERRRKGDKEIHVGIGIHYGETVLGDIGANRLEYAVIGTAVNVAARLEEMTRALNANIVISEQLRFQVEAEEVEVSLFDDLVKHSDQEVRGLDQTMTLWTLS